MRYLIVLPLILLLAVVWQAWAEDSSAEASRKAVKEAETEEECMTCCKEVKAMPPCHCLVELLYDYPGPYDLYYCFTHANNCTEGVGELWYGKPVNPYFPHVCEWNQCEPYLGYKDSDADRVPGHESGLEGRTAWDMAEAALKAAKKKNRDLEWDDAEYHSIPAEQIPEGLGVTTTILVMAVPIEVPATPPEEEEEEEEEEPETKTVYFCMQIDSATTTDIDEFNGSEPRTGRQFYIKYEVDGEEREGLVWLK